MDLSLLIKKVKARTVYLPPALYRLLPRKVQPICSRFHEKIGPILRRVNRPFFVQIGSNDGVSGDPIHGYIMREREGTGILVEPFASAFRKLKMNYRKRNDLIFENVAISDSDDKRKFYTIGQADGKIKKVAERLGSFFPEIVKKRGVLEVRRKGVPCMAFQTLIKKHRVQKIDLLHMDTEGYDYHIIKSMKFDRIKPKIILYEDKHMTDLQRKFCEKLLQEQGYNLVRGRNDTLAYTG